MDRLLGLALLVVSASAVIIMHFLFDHRKLFNWHALSKLPRLANRLKSKDSISHSELIEVLRHFKLPCVIFHFKFCPWFTSSKLAGLARSFDIPNLVNTSKLPELIGCYSFRSLIARFRKCSLASHTKFSKTPEAESSHTTEDSSQLELDVLNCHVRLTTQERDKSASDAFVVELAGLIHAPSDAHCATLRISITDVTGGTSQAKPVQSRVKRWQIENAREFCYVTDLGRLPNKTTTLSDWTTVAQLDIDWLTFPRKGRRDLRLTAAILSCKSRQELARAQCVFAYENPTFGYIDLQENAQRAKTLAVALAFAVSASDQKLYDCEVELIKDWARDNIAAYGPMPNDVHSSKPRRLAGTTNKAGRRLEKALKNAVAFFRTANKLDVYEICKEIAEMVPVADRYDILDLCLHVAQAKGFVAPEELVILKDIATWLEVDGDRFRAMVQKTLPITIHQSKDVEAILGVTANMSKDKTRRRLNKEYGKWNSRVTSSDREIQAQADQMLKLIAETRSEYVG